MAHQNLLAVISQADSRCELKPEVLPEPLRVMCEGLSRDTKLVGITLDYPNLSAEFFRSLNEHGLRMTVRADIGRPERAQFTLDMLGGEDHNRKKRVQMYTALFGHALDVPFLRAHGGTIRSSETLRVHGLLSSLAEGDALVSWAGQETVPIL